MSDKTWEWLKICCEAIKKNEELLTDLDRRIGDGDHGVNMVRGFEAIIATLDEKNALKTAANAVMNSVGGAAGSLYGSGLYAASKKIDRIEGIDDLITFLEAMLFRIKELGGASVGDKTIVDVLKPSLDVLREKRSVEEMINTARNAMAATKDMVAKKGRASYLKERSIGTQDPGATSMYLMIEAWHGLL